ncbi:hypothetical protein J4N45_14620 [Vibrio sp. SCSIO 43140]|uniref:hypothetical protein n=1 Tax=Vibrio sp. SCSIO 43140 TaxID=2819100 RepID=UPI0020757D80|nr:hypothetical protein [Vibrio sp. SCSIO 43140]USD59734.1 hypothetical protein J4N45_14620 [Vibrio sp. SCSIO 43140]
MIDLINNVFSLCFENLASTEETDSVKRFNSEFLAVSDEISYRTGEFVSRIKLATGKDKGKLQQVGVNIRTQLNQSSFFEPIYIKDSPITAWKFYNYLYEFKKIL